MTNIGIKGIGLYVPGKPIDNAEIKQLAGVEFNSQKIEEKIGIQKRHIAKLRGIDETTADFAAAAAGEAIEDAGIDPNEVGYFIVGTDTPEYISPSTAILLQGRLQGRQMNTCSFDVDSSCAGFVTAYDAGARMLAGDPTAEYAVVVGAYNMPAYVRDGDSFGYSIFADGAAAVVLEKRPEKGYLGSRFITDGTQWNYIGVYAGGTRTPITHRRLDEGEYGLQLLQRLPGERNVKLWPPLVRDVLKTTDVDLSELDHVIFTQINRSVIEQVMDILDIPMDKTTTVMDKYGYTGSACVPMAFYDSVKTGRIRRGDTVMFVASGAGLAVGSNIFIY
ncbi:MAG: ketoacyl-ACP synthase III [Spirochaetales bacterium]|nr:ketoacyl-ACP synthase III [Spirochaetales bacterium]MCF7939229.1 ketoacyl-ACP synthase III [Spirochaetales bacterium]